MRKCWLLTKIQMLGFGGFNRLLHTNDRRDKRRLIGMGLVFLLVFIILAAYSGGQAYGLAYLGLTRLIPALMLLTCAAATFIVTFMKCNGVLFGFRDYDMVMSLPVKNSTVIVSRLLSVYLMNFLISCVVVIPSAIVYGLTLNAGPQVWLMLGIALFFAPILPMMASMVVGAAITAISVRFRYKNLITVILSLAVILGLMGFSYRSGWNNPSPSISQLAAYGASFMDAIHRAYPPARLFTDALENVDWIRFGLFVLLSACVAILFVLLLSLCYDRMNSAMLAQRMKGNYRLGTLKASTPFRASYRKELHRLRSCPTYLTNSCVGAIMLVAIAVAVFFMDKEQVAAMFGLADVMMPGRQFAPWMMAILIGMSSTTAVSISLEGKSRWLLYSLPVTTRTIFNAKIALNLTILIPAVLVSGPLLAVAFQTNAIETITLFLFPSIYALFIAVVGLAFNLRFPKFEWTSEYQAVKQSVSVLATLGVGLFTGGACFGLAFLFRGHPTLLLAIATLSIATITTVVYLRICKRRWVVG